MLDPIPRPRCGQPCATGAACGQAAELSPPVELAAGCRATRAGWPSLVVVLLALAGCGVELRDDVDESLQPEDWTSLADAPGPAALVEAATAPLRGLAYRSSSNGCYHQLENHDTVDLTDTELAELRAVVQASRAAQAFDARSLGVTQERLDAQAPVAIEAVMQALAERTGGAPLDAKRSAATRQRIGALLTLEDVVAAAARELDDADSSTNHVEMRAELGGEPSIVLSSKHGSPWMLPWNVAVGDDSWETYSTELPLLLARHLPSSIPNHVLLDGSAYWQDRFWADRHGWLSPLIDRLQREEASRIAEALPGYAEARSMFSIDDATIGFPYAKPRSLHLTLTAKTSQPVDAVWWYNPMGASAPLHGWPQLLEQYARVNRATERFEWLLEWKSRAGQRSVESHITGTRLYGEDDLDTFVGPAWKHAGLPGAPTIQLLLRRGRQAAAELYVSEATRGAIIIRANRHPDRAGEALTAGEHWLDVENVAFHPKNPTYLSVDAFGQFERKTIPENFPPLQRVLKKMGVPKKMGAPK